MHLLRQPLRGSRRHRAIGVGVSALVVIATVVAFLTGSHSAQPAALSLASAAPPQAARPLVTTAGVIAGLQERLRRFPADTAAEALLGDAYLQRVRETGDPTYYPKAQAVLVAALKRDPHNLEALVGAGTLALARHDFRAALVIGERARALNPTVPRLYGIVGDAQIELGMYAAALRTVQTMVDMRPDLSSYSRASYLRELYGRVPGAISAMRMAVDAGGPNAENTQWTRVQLAQLYFNKGDLATAEQQYRQTLAQLPNYVPALAGLAQVRAAQGRYAAAIDLYTQAVQRMPLPQYVIALGDVDAATGDQQEAQRQYGLVRAIDTLLTANGVNTDLETALFFADHGIDLPASLRKARAAYAARQSIHTADGLAWTLYKAGHYGEAAPYAAQALRLGTRDAVKLFHAGMIARALGQDTRARAYLRQALGLNPRFSLLYSPVATSTLTALDRQTGGKR